MTFANPTAPTLAELGAIMRRNDGWLDLRGTGITSLPEGLTVGGSLDLRGTGITSLPEGLTVGGSLDLSGTGITSLPEGLTVGGWLDLRGTEVPILYKDPRGYELRRVMAGSSEWFVCGCRLFRSRADALAHWGSPRYTNKARGAAFCDAINAAQGETA